MSSAFPIRVGSAALALLLVGCLAARADNASWISNANGAWSSGSNWNDGAAPGSTTGISSSDTATFNTNAGGTVTIDQTGQNIGSIVFGPGAGAFTFQNAPGASLLLSNGGSISDNGVTGSAFPSIQQIINAPLVLEPAGSSAPGAYSLTNSAPNISDIYFPSEGFTLSVAGSVSGGLTSGSVTLNLNGSNVGSSDGLNQNTIGGVISDGNAAGGLGITKSGLGNWVLTNANTYSGVTTINGGKLGVSQLANGGVASGLGISGNGAANLLINGGALQYTGSGASTDRLFTINGTTAGATAALDSSGSGAVNFTNTGNLAYGASNQTRTLILTGTNTGTNTLAALVADNGTGATSLTKSGSGTWLLTNHNTYTGPTTVNGGTLGFGGGFINSTSTLVLGGGTISLNTTGLNTQSFNSTIFSSGASSVTAAAGETLNLGTFTANTGATVDFSSTGTITASSRANVNGIFGGYATFGGSTWATAASTSGTAIKGLTSYYTTTTGGNSSVNYTTSENVDVTSSASILSGNFTVNSLRFNAGSETLTLNSSAQNIIVSGGILVTSNAGNNASVITGGTLRSAGSNSLVIIQNNTAASLTINSVIADNTTGLSSGLTKSGAGTLILGGNNSYTGTTTLNAGTLEGVIVGGGSLTINGGTFDAGGTVGALNGAGGTIVDSGHLAIGANNASGSYAGALVHSIPFQSIFLTKVGTGTQTFTGSIASGGLLNINAGGIAVSGGGSITFSEGINLKNSGTTLDLSGGENQSIGRLGGVVGSTVNLGETTLYLGATASPDSILGFLNQPGSFAGTIAGDGGSLVADSGTVTLTGANTYTGGTTVSHGALYVNNSLGSGTGYGSVAVNSGALLAGSGTIAPTSGTGVTINGGGSLYSGGVSSGTPATGPGTGLTLNNGAGLGKILSVGGVAPANLTFALGANGSSVGESSSGPGQFSTPNNNTSYLTVVGNSMGEINFAGAISVTLVDLTNGQLSLQMGTPYLLIQASSTAFGINQLADDSLFAGLVTSLDGTTDDLAMNGNGFVMGVGTLTDYTPISIIQLQSDGVTALADNYLNPQLYLFNGNLEVDVENVPEPSTWALLAAGAVLLVVRRRAKRR